MDFSLAAAAVSEVEEADDDDDDNDIEETVSDDAAAAAEYDPTVRSCGWCYMMLPTEMILPTIPCQYCPRLYCSPSCHHCDQATHTFWCGKAGEKGIDFDICPIDGKGLGMVTKRVFQRGEKILAERPVMTTTNLVRQSTEEHQQTVAEEETSNRNIRTAAMALTPLHGNLNDKVNANGVSLGLHEDSVEQPDTESIAAGLFLTFSRVNHDCLGNSDHYFDHQHGVELLVANDIIPAQTEITFPYSRAGKDRRTDLSWRGFVCSCRACQQPALNSKVESMVELDLEIVHLGAQSAHDERAKAVKQAHTLLHIYDEVHASCRDYARIHYDLFQILVVQDITMLQARHHMHQAYQYALSFCGYENHPTVFRYKEYVDHPELHNNYRVME